MKNSYVTDTVALVLRLEKRRMGSKAKQIFIEAESGLSLIYIPAMVLAEIGYLAERKKIDANLRLVENYCQQFESLFFEPITKEIIFRSFEIDDIPELHDRLIAATAYVRNIPLITNDAIIAASRFVSTVW